MIRNNKQKVTDMRGAKLFPPASVSPENFDYSADEINFYNKLTEYITRGLAFANNANPGARRIIGFVLITMQKLAASSVAAVRSAISKRLANLKNSSSTPETVIEYGEIDDGSEEEAAEKALKQTYAQPDEIRALEELATLAEKISNETKISKIIEKIKSMPESESVLLFTEFKATQALLVSELRKKFGADSVAFINGEGALEINGLREFSRREKAATDFNRGAKRFLVSTEASGEGVDLHEHCHILMHADLPWNPMRLHQRAGRLHRYGQKLPVEIYIFHNPETVESKIWDMLELKLDKITRAFQAMEDPEDMRMAVIGAQTPQFFNDLFLNARKLPQKGLREWFDAETATFGGKEAISQVREIFGNASRFDFKDAANALPQADLEHLMPFMKLSLARLGVRPKINEPDYSMSFDAPKQYRADINIAGTYNLTFSRRGIGEEEERGGLGSAIVDKLVGEGERLPEKFAALPGLANPLFVFRVQDRSTENSASRQRIFCVELTSDGPKLYRDWESLLYLNRYADKPRSLKTDVKPRRILVTEIEEAEKFMKDQLPILNLPYALPKVEDVAILCPAERVERGKSEEQATDQRVLP